MDAILFRKLNKLQFKDPKDILIGFREIEINHLNQEVQDDVKTLRIRELNKFLEIRQASLFCYFVGERIGTKVYLGYGENVDFDFVAKWSIDGQEHFAPIQLKEVTQHTEIGSVIDSLKKYVPPKNLIVVIHLNQNIRFEPSEIAMPKLNISELWFFGAISPTQNTWGLWGDFCKIPIGTKHQFPII